jgi:hypothetical protein
MARAVRRLAAVLAASAALVAALLLWWPAREPAGIVSPAAGSAPAAPAPELAAASARREAAPADPAGTRLRQDATAFAQAQDVSFTWETRSLRGRAWPLEVRALDAASGAPVPGALVHVRRGSEVFDRQTTDPAGRAVMSAAWDDDVVVTAEGYAPWIRCLTSPGMLVDVPGAGRLRPDETWEPIEARLLHPARLHGKVTSSDGLALAGVVVRTTGVNLPSPLRDPEATTDDQGRYSFTLPPSDWFHVEVADAGGTVLKRHESLWSVASGEDLQVDFVVGLPSAVHGRVVDAGGVSVGGEGVCLHQGSDLIGAPLPTSADGRFRFEGVPPGSYRLTLCEQPRGAGLAERFAGLTVDGSGQDVECDVVVSSALWITGVVRQADGPPASNALVSGSGTEQLSAYDQCGEDGAFCLGPFLAGPVQLRAVHTNGMLLDDVVIEAGMQGVELILVAGGTLRVVLPATVSGTLEIVSRAEVGDRLNVQRFHGVSGLAPGLYDVIVKTRDCRFGLARDVRIASGETTSPAIELVPGAWLRLRCGPALFGLDVDVSEGGQWIGSAWLSSGEGREIVPAGRPLRVRARTADGAFEQETTVTLAPGETRALVFPLDG